MQYFGRLTKTEWEIYHMLLTMQTDKNPAISYKKACIDQHRKYGHYISVYHSDGWIKAHDDNNSSIIVKKFYPGEDWTEEEWKDYEESMSIPFYPSPYDCTGQLFTVWMKKFKVPGGVWVYHHISTDI